MNTTVYVAMFLSLLFLLVKIKLFLYMLILNRVSPFTRVVLNKMI